MVNLRAMATCSCETVLIRACSCMLMPASEHVANASGISSMSRECLRRWRQVGIIPARYASLRFPGKPLALIAGVPMIIRTYQQVRLDEHVAHRPDHVCR